MRKKESFESEKLARDGKKATTKDRALRFNRLAIYLNQSEVESREMTCFVDMQNKRAIVLLNKQKINKFNR